MNAWRVHLRTRTRARIASIAASTLVLFLAFFVAASMDWWDVTLPLVEARAGTSGAGSGWIAMLSASVPAPTPTPTASPSATPTRVPSPTPTSSPVPTATSTSTSTPVPSSTATSTKIPVAIPAESNAAEPGLSGPPTVHATGVPTRTPTATPTLMANPTAQPSRISSMNGRFLLLNMHGMLFHDDQADIPEDIAYAKWMGAGVIRTMATDNNSGKTWSGGAVGDRIADIAPSLRAAGVKLIVALVNNHKAVPGELPESAGWMDGYHQLLLPFYTDNWRGAYLAFARELISTVRARGAQDVVFAWEVGNELHTPQEVKAIVPFMKSAVAEIRKLDADTPILPGTMGAWHLQPWVPTSEIARWLYCEAPFDAYTLHAYDWVNWDRQGDMPISFDFDNILKPCQNGRRLPVIVEELGTSRQLAGVYAAGQEEKRLIQERNQIRFVLNYPNVIGIGAWSAESPKVRERTFFDNQRGLTSYGADAQGGGSCYDPTPMSSPGVRCQLEQMLRALPSIP